MNARKKPSTPGQKGDQGGLWMMLIVALVSIAVVTRLVLS